MHKWRCITAILILVLGFTSGVAEGKASSLLNEGDSETVTLPNLSVYAGSIYTKNTTAATLNNQCWKGQEKTYQTHLKSNQEEMEYSVETTESEKSCFTKSTSPNNLLNKIPPLKAKQGGEIFLIMSTTESSNTFLLEPDKIEVKQIKSNENVNIGVTDYQITAPSENGNYRYSVMVYWNELELQASYIFDVTVR